MSHTTWGGRFSKDLDPRVMHFNASLAFDKVLYAHDIAGSRAHAKMLARQGLILEYEAELICNALAEIGQEIEQGMQELDASCEDIHMFIEKLLIAKIGEPGKKLHTGRSRNDQVALDLRLYSRDAGSHVGLLLRHLTQG
jgi:argininosuccinate lyase